MGDNNWKFQGSKEDQTQRISKSIFVTNFLEHFTAKDLWNVCIEYGIVIDVFIPFKKSKLVNDLLLFDSLRIHRNNSARPAKLNVGNASGSFAHVLKSGTQHIATTDHTSPAMVLDDSCFSERDVSMSLMGKVKDVTSLPNLYLILKKEGFRELNLTYLGGLWVLIDMDSEDAIEKIKKHTGVGSWFSVLKLACNSFVSDDRIIWISLEGLPLKVWSRNTFVKIASKWGDMVEWEISDDDNSLNCKVHWIRAKEMKAWSPFFHEGSTNSTNDEESEGEDARSLCGTKNDSDSNIERVSESSCMHEKDILYDNAKNTPSMEPISSEDPFGIYDILNKKTENVEQSKEEELKYPPGFTPNTEKMEEQYAKNEGANVEVENVTVKPISSKPNNSFSQGSVFSRDIYGLHKNKTGGSILEVLDEIVKVIQTMRYNMEALQETKMERMKLFTIKDLWGNFAFDYACSPSVGNSGGILCVWDPRLFVKDNVSSSDYFLAARGTWIPTSTKLLIISVYAPQELTEKRELWDYLRLMIDRWNGEYIILGDFNEVRSENKRFGSSFNIQGANAFNNFIALASLIDLSLEGYAFTWAQKLANKMSKLDHFLISKGVLSLFPSLSALCLDRHLSDHRPILMRELNVDYGLTPFRIFHSWFEMEGFDKVIEETWMNTNVEETNAIIKLKRKLQALKAAIKNWSSNAKSCSYKAKTTTQKKISDIDKLLDQGRSNEEILNTRAILLKELQDINTAEFVEMAQRAKIRWAIEGDENSKYFHGILKQKRSQLAIRGFLVDGEWIVDPSMVKNEFFTHFSNRFLKPISFRIRPIQLQANRLSVDQIKELECYVSQDEIKRAVWDCGTNKTPGPDGFSFEFFRRYWHFLEDDIIVAVKEFFSLGTFPNGCNVSFITLIPKIQDAKDLISEVQSAFITNRQILDGPFILNELLSWCKHKKLKAMLFKVDFEKAFDSVRWDYLDDLLKMFGFGNKWRGWINGCLKSAMGSVLVNGNPTSEFKFHKGLKHGDPLSPFLFIMIMESLHLSFRRVMDADLFYSISINNTLTISNLFYADDDVFVGK
ncbi:RNA-directed DNA polymerase, eukaryota [Tanacetum coccineum]